MLRVKHCPQESRIFCPDNLVFSCRYSTSPVVQQIRDFGLLVEILLQPSALSYLDHCDLYTLKDHVSRETKIINLVLDIAKRCTW